MASLLSRLHRPALGYHLLRISVAALMLFHGAAKLSNGIDGIQAMLASAGLPAFIAYGVYAGELIAPLLVLLGIFVAPAALVMAANMVFAVGLAHLAQVFTLGKSGGWAIELQALFFIASLAVAFLAPAPRERFRG
ncbi:hypothetical protein D3C71_23190 [compost metagenome]